MASILLTMFVVTSAFVLLYDYPLGSRPMFSRPGPSGEGMWTGGTIPDEDGYFGWAQIYFETGKQYVYLEDLGPDKLAGVDFFLGSNESDSVFTTYSIVHEESQTPEWVPKARDIWIDVIDGNGRGIGNASIHLIRFSQSGDTQHWNFTTDDNGSLLIDDALPGPYLYEVRTPENPNAPLLQRFVTDYPNLDYPILLGAQIESMTSTAAQVRLHVDHYANPNLPDVPILAGPPQNPLEICTTDEHGDCVVDLPAGGRLHHLTAVKENEGIFPPVASGIVEVDGRYAVANHWPPGYCYLIIPFWITGTIGLIGVFLSALAVLSTFALARRFTSLRGATLSSVLVMVCGLALMMLYSRGMADYASMAFATAGIALFIESLQNWREKHPRFGGPLAILLGVAGGLSMAYSVTMRYSTVAVLLGLLVYLYLTADRGDRGWRRLLPRRSALMRGLQKVIPFLAGLAIIGVLLAAYNAHLFGGPLNSGYQMSTRATFDPGTGNLTITQPEKSMFESYFHPSWEMFENVWTTILPTLFLLIPIIYMAPVALWQERRRKETWLMFFWLLPIYVIYMQLTWVGHIYEDMRYFLPVLSPTAILVSFSLERNFLSDSRLRVCALIIVVLLAVSGLLVADYCISWQLARLTGGMRGMSFDPPAAVSLFAASAIIIFYGGVIYNALRKRIRVAPTPSSLSPRRSLRPVVPPTPRR